MTDEIDLGALVVEANINQAEYESAYTKAVDEAVQKAMQKKWLLEDMWLLSHLEDGELRFETGPGKDHLWTEVHCGEQDCCGGSVIYYVCQHCHRREPAQYSNRFDFRWTGLYFGRCPGEEP
jgi:hypothetical protein